LTDDILTEIRSLRQEVQNTRERVIRLEVGVGILRWLFAALLGLITVSATIASIIVGYLQAGAGG
jgi:hypothetical protein